VPGFFEGFERFWNSSFGLPQQAIFRLLRVIQDPDVDFFDEEGFADASLIPGLGIFDSDRQDVGAKEQVQRFSQATGDVLGLDPDGFAAQLGVGIATDPISFLGGGVSALGKSGARVGKARNVLPVKNAIKASKAPQLTNKALAGHIDDALAKPGLARKQRSILNQAKAELPKFDPEELVAQAVAKSSERELRIGLPLLVDFGKLTRPVHTDHGSWFGLIGSKTPGAKLAGRVLMGPGMRVPVLRAAVRSVADAGAGIKLGTKPHSGLSAEGLSGAVNKDLAHPDMGSLYARITGPRKEQIAAAGDSAEELFEAVRGRSGDEKMQNLLLRATGKESLEDLSRADIDNFVAQYERNSSKLVDEATQRHLSETGKRAGSKSFAFGRKLKSVYTSMFRSDAGLDDLIKSQATINDITARNTEALRQLMIDGSDLIAKDAAKLGMPPEDLESLYLNYLQFSAHNEDLVALKDVARNQPDAASSFGNNLVSSALRMTSAAKTFIAMARGGKSTPGLKQLADVMEGQMTNLSDLSRFTSKFDELGEVRVRGDLPKPDGFDANSHFLSRGPLKGRYLGYVNDQQLTKRRETLLRKGTKKGEFDTRNLDALDQDDYSRITEVLEARRTGAETFQAKKPRPTEVTPSDPRIPSQTFAEIETDLGPALAGLDGFELAIGKMLAMGTELRRTTSTGVLSPAAVEFGIGAANDLGRAADAMLLDALGKDAQGTFKFLREQQSKITAEAVRHGLLAPSSGIAYIGRIMSHQDSAIVDDVLQSDIVQETLQDILPQLSSSFARSANNMSLEELNDLRNALRKQNPEIAAKLDEVAKRNGLKLGRFETSPINIMVSRLGQAKQRDASVQFFEDSLDALSESGAAMAGRVTHRVMASGRKVEIGSVQKAAKVGAGKGLEQSVDLKRSVLDTETSGFVLQDHRGKEHFVPKSVLGDHMIVAKLGKRDRAVVPGFEGESVDATANAFALRASKGKLSPADLVDDPSATEALLDSLVDEHIILGDEQAVRGMFGALSAQYEHSHALASTFDTVNNHIKRWQTVSRPAFHFFNVGSAQFQTAALGVSPVNIMAANMDAIRFLTGDKNVAKVYNKVGMYIGTPKGGRVGWVARASRRAGGKDLDLAVKPERAVMKEFGLEAEDLLFHAGGQSYDVGEIIQAFGDGGLYGTFISQGLKGSSKTSIAQEFIRKQALDTSKLGKAKKFLGQKGQDLGEATEIYARTMAVFGQLRQGVPLDQAVANAKLAMVNYSNVTKFERNVMKRAFTYYTFPRHYLPFAYKHFAENPATFSRGAQLMRSAEAESGSPLRENNGRMELNVPFSRRIDLTRLNPNLEAIKLVEAAGEIVLGTGSELNELFGGTGFAAAQQESLNRGTEQPFTVGSPGKILFSAFDGDERTTAIQEASDAFWISRFAFDPGDPLGETTPLTKLLEGNVLGTKSNRPKAMQRALEGRYNRLIRDMERRAELTQDLDYRRELRAEAKALTELAKQHARNL